MLICLYSNIAGVNMPVDGKKIAFFGDSFATFYAGWIKSLTQEMNLVLTQLGKPGNDQLHAFERWQALHDNFPTEIDYCVYFHTEANRPYCPNIATGLTAGILINAIQDNNDIPHEIMYHFNFNVEEAMKFMKAHYDYMLYARDPNEANLKSMLIPMAIDRYMKERNTRFKKILHMWSFAPMRETSGPGRGWSSARSTWPFNIESGSNVMLDMSTLSYLDPTLTAEDRDNIEKGQFRDYRPNHFGDGANWFVHNIVKYMLEQEGNVVVDFSPHINPDSVWTDYTNAWKTIKSELDGNK